MIGRHYGVSGTQKTASQSQQCLQFEYSRLKKVTVYLSIRHWILHLFASYSAGGRIDNGIDQANNANNRRRSPLAACRSGKTSSTSTSSACKAERCTSCGTCNRVSTAALKCPSATCR